MHVSRGTRKVAAGVLAVVVVLAFVVVTLPRAIGGVLGALGLRVRKLRQGRDTFRFNAN